MNPATLAYAIQLLSSLPGLISSGLQVVDLIQDGKKKLELFQTEGRDPTTEEWEALNSRIASLRDELHKL